MDEEVFCEASIFNFQNKLITHYKQTGEDLIEKVFCQLTIDQIKLFGVDTKVQRGDSFLVGSNIADYCRLELLIEVLKRFVRVLDDEDSSRFKEDVLCYTQFSATNYFYHTSKDQAAVELNKIALIYRKIYIGVADKYSNNPAYINFKRVFNEHFLFDKAKAIKVIPSNELHSAILMSPDDNEATFRKKQNHSSKGYVTHVSETVIQRTR